MNNVRIPRVVFLTDIITPYFLPTFEELSARLDLVVVFCAATGSRGMEWSINRAELAFDHCVVAGVVVGRGNPDGTDYYVDPRILAKVMKLSPDVIISGGFSVPTAYAALHGAARRSRLVIYSDGTSVSEAKLSVAQRLVRHILVPRASAAVAKSKDAAARFVELGVAPSAVFEAPHTTSLAPLWGLPLAQPTVPSEGLTVLSVGRLIERKGLAQLIRAVGIAQREASVRLRIVGTGPAESALRSVVREAKVADVTFAGFVQQSELPAVYAAADVFAFPTRRDPFGIAALEAAAAGLPLLSSPYAGSTADLVEEGVSGYVVDPEDLTAVAARLVTLARSPELRLRLGYAARARTRHRTPAAAADGYARAVTHAMRAGGKDRRSAGRRQVARR